MKDKHKSQNNQLQHMGNAKTYRRQQESYSYPPFSCFKEHEIAAKARQGIIKNVDMYCRTQTE